MTVRRRDRQKDKQKSPCVLQNFVPFRAAAQKVNECGKMSFELPIKIYEIVKTDGRFSQDEAEY